MNAVLEAQLPPAEGPYIDRKRYWWWLPLFVAASPILGIYLAIRLENQAYVWLTVILWYIILPSIASVVLNGNCRHVRETTREMWRGFVRATIVLLFLIYPNLCTNVAEVFLDFPYKIQGKTYLLNSFKVDTGTSAYHFMRLCAWGGFLLYGLGIPLFCFVFLRRNAAEQQSPPSASHLTLWLPR